MTLEARRASTGARSAGRAIASSDRYGFFTLPAFTSDPTLPEVIVKMLDFRSTSGNFLFFYTGLTSLDYTLTVTDTWTGAARTFQGPANYCGAVESIEEPSPTDLGGIWWGTVSFPTTASGLSARRERSRGSLPGRERGQRRDLDPVLRYACSQRHSRRGSPDPQLRRRRARG